MTTKDHEACCLKPATTRDSVGKTNQSVGTLHQSVGTIHQSVGTTYQSVSTIHTVGKYHPFTQ